MWIHGFISLIIAVAVSFFLVKTLRRRAPGPWSGLLYFFIIIFFFVWAAGAWIYPAGPTILGATWVTFTIAGVLLLLVIAALTAPSSPSETRSPGEWKDGEEAEREIVETTVSIFFWIALAGLFFVIVASYF